MTNIPAFLLLTSLLVFHTPPIFNLILPFKILSKDCEFIWDFSFLFQCLHNDCPSVEMSGLQIY